MKNNITYGIDVEAELIKILNKQILNSIRKDFRRVKIKKIYERV
jgi:hypothetical protein